jgi:hypothetical protein
VERFYLRKLSELETRKQYPIKIPNRFAALENLNDSEDINRAWKNIKQEVKTGAKQSLSQYGIKRINHGLIKNVYFSRSKEAC